MQTIEKIYIENVSLDHRKKYGQFYTCNKIAEFMIRWLLQFQPQNIYDPAFGLGIFFSQAKLANFQGKFFGTEIDQISYNFYNSRNTSNDIILKNCDYFSKWELNIYDAIICNPPYSKFQKFENRKTILNQLSYYISEKISGYTNIASAFLLKSILELKQNGLLAYIMPFEFLNTGYGKTIKKFLLLNGIIHNIIKIEEESSVFDNVTTTSCIVLYEKCNNNSYIKFSKLNSIEKMDIKCCSSINPREIKTADKWGIYFNNSKKTDSISNFVTLSFYGKFKRGIATGSNDFFVLRKSDILKYKLDFKYFSICISKSNQIKSSFFDDKNIFELSDKDAPIYLLNISNNDISENLLKYIKYGESIGINNRYLTKCKNPWYSIEKREPAKILFGVFSRDRFKIIRNTSRALSLTCYHCFYPKPMFAIYTDILFIYLKSNIAKMIISQNQRTYGNKLIKFEPNDLSNILVPSMAILEKFDEDFIQTQLNSIIINDKLTSEGELTFKNFVSIGQN